MNKIDGSFVWTYVRRMYRDWGSLKTVLKAFALTIAICFLFVAGIVGCESRKVGEDLLVQCKIWGLILLGFESLALVSYFMWAWANGGVDEWEYRMNDSGIRGKKVVRKAWRMKLLRGFAWILMLFPAKPSQKMAMRRLLYEDADKTVEISFAGVKEVSGDEASGKIAFQTSGGTQELLVPPEDYAEIFARIGERIHSPRKRFKI